MKKAQIHNVHPFPARMASELAINTLRVLPPGSLVLDPMSGSGTVLRQSLSLGHKAIGFDLDPLAVLMSRVWTTFVPDELIASVAEEIISKAHSLRDSPLDWIDSDIETSKFVEFWFAPKQRAILRSIAASLSEFETRRYSVRKHAAADVIRIALSRIIVTKEQCASLARDTSHSRPHRVASTSDYDVLAGLRRSIRQIRNRLLEAPPTSGASVRNGDARNLVDLANGSIDGVLTSPPYLNAIDYLRGHRMSLVWFGFKISDLRSIRSHSIGAERAPDQIFQSHEFSDIRLSMGEIDLLPSRHKSMVDRYTEDLYRLASETSRVLRSGGLATFVIGNSCLKGVYVNNSNGLSTALQMCGLKKISEIERELPAGSRYLPIASQSALGKRMRTETVLAYGQL